MLVPIRHIITILFLGTSGIIFYYLMTHDLDIIHSDYTDRQISNYSTLVSLSAIFILILSSISGIISFKRPSLLCINMVKIYNPDPFNSSNSHINIYHNHIY